MIFYNIYIVVTYDVEKTIVIWIKARDIYKKVLIFCIKKIVLKFSHLLWQHVIRGAWNVYLYNLKNFSYSIRHVLHEYTHSTNYQNF